ncbi:ABC transporter permease subunit [Microvirga sp. W0021]|uniref:ABC transporter permease subunit n=1 Tax=Hohaiivirga grylli TaxID=3133970 RepID=A0ABV0BKF5_9HYPH
METIIGYITDIITGYIELIFGANGWIGMLLSGAGMTILVAIGGFCFGGVVGSFVAWAKIAGGTTARTVANIYTTILRGVPDLLIIYLFYFGGSALLTSIGQMFGSNAFIGLPSFITGVMALGIVSGAYQAEVFRGAYSALSKGELEAAKSVGMHRNLMFRRIIVPQVLRYAIPGLGNIWQLILKQSALISVTGLIELLFVSRMAASATRMPFPFYFTAIVIYLVITAVSGWGFKKMEQRAMRGVKGA